MAYPQAGLPREGGRTGCSGGRSTAAHPGRHDVARGDESGGGNEDVEKRGLKRQKQSQGQNCRPLELLPTQISLSFWNIATK
jgi:hypothetical protein